MLSPSSRWLTTLQHLVYSGAHLVQAGHTTFDAKVCNYLGSPHLCFTQFRGPFSGGPSTASFSQILDEKYRTVRTIGPTGEFAGQPLKQDLHEFHVVGSKGQTALITSYVTFPHHVAFPGCPHSPISNYTRNGLFSEVTTDGKNTTLFQWSAVDHVDPTDAYVCPGDLNSGGGTSQTDGFDFL